MPWIKWFASGRKHRKPLGTGDLSDRQSTEQLRKILDRERARADRTGEPLSAIIFTPASDDVVRATQQKLKELLSQRLRCTDEIGDLADGRIVAVLPGAAAVGAVSVADDVRAGFGPPLPAPKCAIYSYPTDWLPEDSSYEDGVQEIGEQAQPVRPMELLFMQGMPLWKRGMDVTLATTALVALSPVLAVIAISIKATSRGPVLFRQRRSGLGGRPFLMNKFRSMVTDAESRKAALRALNEQDGPAFKITNDPRITRLGRFLRATSLDELPQLWNVVKGEMSLVGPRPLPCNESAGCHSWQRRRLDVTPGLTCIWQVHGRSMVSFTEWMRMDLRYIVARRFRHDVSLLWKTAKCMLIRTGR